MTIMVVIFIFFCIKCLDTHEPIKWATGYLKKERLIKKSNNFKFDLLYWSIFYHQHVFSISFTWGIVNICQDNRINTYIPSKNVFVNFSFSQNPVTHSARTWCFLSPKNLETKLSLLHPAQGPNPPRTHHFHSWRHHLVSSTGDQPIFPDSLFHSGNCFHSFSCLI